MQTRSSLGKYRSEACAGELRFPIERDLPFEADKINLRVRPRSALTVVSSLDATFAPPAFGVGGSVHTFTWSLQPG
jgi:hypothetical protein